MEGKVLHSEYSDIMRKSYIDYAMSVIVARALPDVRDGLKPVQRRTLYDMHELAIHHDRPYRKCARIVGDTMGKYHPHGDSSIYEALVVMAQDFKKGQILVDGHGNFGSIEGDGAAAMRYTEARLAAFTEDAFLKDLDKDVVSFLPNFDETEREPEVLPSRIPNLLVNGAEGIAVGMATSIPPHNMAEVIDATVAYMKNNAITTEELLSYVKGPDFPTGGIVINKDDLLKIYETGEGKIRLRGRIEEEKGRGGRKKLVITEIPYTMVGNGIMKFQQDVAKLVENKVTGDIVDISNASSRDGIRIVLELKKGTDIENIKNMLYKKTRLEDTFGVNMLAVSGGKPETMGIKKILEKHVDFQFEITTRKYRTLLEKELENREIEEGLIKACDVIDLIIEILRGSRDLKQAKTCLIEGETEGIRFKTKTAEKKAQKLRFTKKQADAILSMRLYKLIGLEVEALMAKHAETLKKISRYEEILNSYDVMAGVIMDEMTELKKAYARERKTVIKNGREAVFEVNPVEEKDVVVLIDRFGYARSVDTATFERNKEAAESENRFVIPVKNTGTIGIFTAQGELHQIRVLDLPCGKFRDKGMPIDNVSNFVSRADTLVGIGNMAKGLKGRFIFVTKDSLVKIVDGAEFDGNRKTLVATKLQAGDQVVKVLPFHGEENIVLQSKNNYLLKFETQELPVNKKTAQGVRGMALKKHDEISEAYVFFDGTETKGQCGENLVSLNKLKLSHRASGGTKYRQP